jgi:16S rRNA (adenine1518-N6/adenine1519-N6)-dimethyltransferase
VLSHFFTEPKYMFKIDKKCYFPSPAVHGALALFTLRTSAQRAPVRSESEFVSFVRQSFNSKRKMLANSLQRHWDRELVNRAIEQLGFTVSVRCSSPAGYTMFWRLHCSHSVSVP